MRPRLASACPSLPPAWDRAPPLSLPHQRHVCRRRSRSNASFFCHSPRPSIGCPQVQKRGPSPPAERPETVLDAGSGPERRRHSCAQAESVIGTCVPPRANWSLTYPHRPHIPTRPPLRCPLHSAFARLRRAHSDRLKYPQVPSSRPIPVAGSRLLCAPGRPSRGLGHLQARLRAIPLRRRLESP